MALTGLGLLAGCSTVNTTPGVSTKSKTLRIVCDPGTPPELAGAAKLYRQKTGTEISYITLPYNGVYNRYMSEFSSGQLSFDIAAVDSVWLPTFGAAFASLDDLCTQEVRDDLIPPAIEEATIGGKIVGIPMWVNSEILYYRKDKFEDPAEQAAFRDKYGYDLQPPKDWNSFRDAAEFFTRSPKLYGTDVKGSVETEYLSHVLQAGSDGVVLSKDNTVIVDNDAHVEALKYYSGLSTRYRVDPPGTPQNGWAESFNLFSQGTTAMMRYWTHGYSLITKDQPAYGKIGVVPLMAGPKGRAGIPGDWHLSIPAKGTHNEQAKDFLRFAFEHNDLNINSSLGLVARTSAIKKYAADGKHPHYVALLETLTASRTAIRPVSPKWQEIVDRVLVPTIQRSVVRGADIPGLLAGARREIENIVA